VDRAGVAAGTRSWLGGRIVVLPAMEGATMIGRFVIALAMLVVGTPLVIAGGLASAVGGFVCWTGLVLWERANELIDIVWETTP
jgi:hypothetical protein